MKITTSRPEDLKSKLAAMQLPALSQSAVRLLQLSQDPDVGPAEFAVPIEGDPGLTGQVMRFVNSSYFGFSGKILTVKHAVTLVGIRTIKNFALYSAVFSMMPNPKCGLLELKMLWSDSLRRALFARHIGQLLRLGDEEELFIAALLQDMALPFLTQHLPDEYAELLKQRQELNCRLSELELDWFNWTHAEIASLIAEKWNLPKEFSRLIGVHISNDLTNGPSEDRDALVVALSALLPAGIDEAWHEHGEFLDAYDAVMGPAAPSVETVLQQIDSVYADFAPCLSLGKAERSLMAYHETQLESYAACDTF